MFCSLWSYNPNLLFLQVLLRMLGFVCFLDGPAEHPQQSSCVSAAVLFFHCSLFHCNARGGRWGHQAVRFL